MYNNLQKPKITCSPISNNEIAGTHLYMNIKIAAYVKA